MIEQGKEMISRYSPTYTYRDLVKSFARSRDAQVAKELEQKIKDRFKARHAYLLDSGKTAINLLLQAYQKTGAVLTPAYNCIAVPQAVDHAGYFPKFVDARPGKLNVEVDDFASAITPDVQVLMPVHLFGIPWPVDRLKEVVSQPVLIVEDAAPAFGSSLNGEMVGTFADASIFSFHWTKPLSSETGGMLLTNNDELAKDIERLLEKTQSGVPRTLSFLRAWFRKVILSRGFYPLTRWGHRLLNGEDMYEVVPREEKRDKHFFGMDPFACALVLEQLGRLDWNIQRRGVNADIYKTYLQDLDNVILPNVPEASQSSWIQYPILVQPKYELFKYMQSKSIDVTWTYRYSCPDTYNMANFTNSSSIAKTVIGLPTYPGLREEDVHRIGKLTRAFFHSN